jgi:hypothetical protein
MRSDSGVRIERTDNELTVRSNPTSAITKWCGALVAGFALSSLIIGWNRSSAENITEDVVGWIGLVLMVIFLVVGISFVFPRSVITVFDLRSQRILRREHVFAWHNRTRTYSFAEIACVGVSRSNTNDDESLPVIMPVISLKNGTMLPLCTLSFVRSEVSDSGCAKSIDAICAATGLQKCDKEARSTPSRSGGNG